MEVTYLILQTILVFFTFMFTISSSDFRVSIYFVELYFSLVFGLNCTAVKKSILDIFIAMGRIFLEHMGGKRLYSCMKCKANLTNYDQLISTNFSGTSGTAFLFNKVVNITFSEVQERMMGSGRQFIRVVSCKKCNLKLGYIYEFAQKDGEQYKEGKIMLERSKIIEEDGLENEI